MHTSATYLARTESAVRKLFEGIESYTDLLLPIRGATFVSSGLDPATAKFQDEFDTWAKNHAVALAASIRAQRAYSEEAFAMATLCGAVLQVAAKAIECYSNNQVVPTDLQCIVGDSQTAKPFCVGRTVRGVPIGLVIFAGRNQHTHFNDPKLHRVNIAVFERLAVLPELASVKDPALDLDNPRLDSYASNITFTLGWCSYDAYATDLRSLLGI